MARKPRIHCPGAIYHVMLRGNGGTDIFLDDQDRYRFYLLLQEGTERFGYRIHALCLMTNHVHLALQVDNIPLSRIIQNLSFRHARWINWRRKTFGHVFQGRYKAILVDGDSYFLQLAAYLHLNPVRAGMVDNPEDYQWSSHRHYLEQEKIPWLTDEPVLSQFSSNVLRARQLFKQFVDDQREEGHCAEFHGKEGHDSRFLGDDLFVEQALRQADMQSPIQPNFEDVHRAIRKTFNVTDAQLKDAGQGRKISEIRALFAWAILEMSDSTLGELGKTLNRDASSLSSAVKRLQQRAAEDSSILEAMERIKENVELATLQA